MSEVGTTPPAASTIRGPVLHNALPDLLEGIPLFAKVRDVDLDPLATSLIERCFAKGTVIIEEGLPGDYMYIIREGRVKVTMASGDGRERISSLLGAGDFFGEMALIDLRPRSASATALEPTTLLSISRMTFLDLLRHSSELSMEVICCLARRLREADEQATSMCFLGVKDRTRHAIESLVRSGGRSFPRSWSSPVTHQQIAEVVGSSRETVTRAIQELKREGEVEQRGKRYRSSARG